MAITTGDNKWHLSINDGPGNSEAQPDVNDSIGGFVATTEVSGTALNNLFDNITGDQNAAETVDYRLIFLHNSHSTLTWEGVKVWISAEVANGADAAIALDGIGKTDVDSSDPQAERIANETTAPSGESFSAPTTKGTGLSVGDLAPGKVQGIWIRRTATNSAPLDNDGVTLRAEGDTAA